MKRLIAAAGVEMVVTCAAFAAAAKTSDSIERCLRMVTDAVRTMSVPQPWAILLPGLPACKDRIESAADGDRTRIRCREGRANEIFGCASNNRNPIDR